MTTLPSTTLTEPQEEIANLRTAFAAVVMPTVARYTELVGSSMVMALRRDLNDVAQTNAWDIQVTLSGLADVQAFETPDAAARAYRVLVRTIINHMTIVIGTRLASSAVREIAQQLDPFQRQLVKNYHLVPETTLSDAIR